jgi:hypothetical protein
LNNQFFSVDPHVRRLPNLPQWSSQSTHTPAATQSEQRLRVFLERILQDGLPHDHRKLPGKACAGNNYSEYDDLNFVIFQVIINPPHYHLAI